MRRRWMIAASLLLAVSAVILIVLVRLPAQRFESVPAVSPHSCGEPVTISTAKALGDFATLKNGDTIENNPITRWAKERLCIRQVNEWLVADRNQTLTDRIKQALTNRERLPDVLFLTSHDLPGMLPDLAASGQIEDIREAFDAYAPPRIKEAYARNPDVWRTVTIDGRRWGLPQISDGKLADPILWIRQDWLDRLELAAPTTLDELEKVLHAFTYEDPDGNGKDDTVGLALAGQNKLNDWMGDASFVFGAYGDQPYQWNRAADGTLAYGSIQPSVKKALIRLADWYAKGYMAPDFGTHDEMEAVTLFTSGVAGILSGPGWMGGWPLGEMKPEGAVYKPIPYPAGPDGRIGRIGSKLSYGSYVFRKGFEHFDAIFAYYDKVYGSLIEDPESDFAIGFAEGYDYILKDGEPVYDFEGNTSTLTNFFLIAPGSKPPHIPGESLESRVYRGQVTTNYEKKMASTVSRLYLEGRMAVDSQLPYSRKDEFSGPYTPEMSLRWRFLEKLEKQAFLQIVYGKTPPEAFDRFAAEWRENGGDAVTREVNEWEREYERNP